MTTVAQAVIESGYQEPPDGDLCIARIEPGGKILHASLRDCAERDLSSLSNVYMACGIFKRGSITVKGGRTRDNLIAVVEIPFDADLKDFLGVPQESIHRMSDDELALHIEALVADCREVFDKLDIPIHRIIYTGYGAGLFVRVAEQDRHRIDDIAHVNRTLVERINTAYGKTLVDPGAKGAGERLMRLVGSFNRKGLTARGVYTIARYPGEVEIDRFQVEPAPPPRALAVVPNPLADDDLRDIAMAVSGDYAEGHRHGIALGLAAMMLKSGVPVEQAERVYGVVVAGDPEEADRWRAFDDTCKRFAAGLPISGYYRLANHMSESVRQFVDGRLQKARHIMMAAALPAEAGSSENPSKYEPLPEECFYGVAGRYRDLVAPTTEAPDCFHFASFVTVAGVYLGRRAMSKIGTVEHFPLLHTILVGPSGQSRKDTAISAATSFFEQAALGPGGRHYDMPYETLTHLSTAEGLLQFMSETNPRTLIYSSEFDEILKNARREVSSTLMSFITRLWNCPPRAHLPTRKDPLVVEAPFLALLAATTPEALARYVDRNNIEQGMANRTLFIYGEGKGIIPHPPDINDEARKELWRDITFAVDRACGSFRRFTMTPGATALDGSWYIGVRTREYPSAVERTLSERLQANARRVALVLSAVNGETAISEGAMQAGIALAEWEFAHKCRHAKVWGANDEGRCMEEIRDIVERGAVGAKELFETLGSHWGTLPLRVVEAMIKMGRLGVNQYGQYVAA